MHIHEIITETEDISRQLTQAQFMQGQCAVLALTIHNIDFRRYQLGFIYEFFDEMPDIYLDPDEFAALDPHIQQSIKTDDRHWALTHAYVMDSRTGEYIDATGRHKNPPDIGYGFNATRHNKFPAESVDLVRVSTHMEWDEQKEEWIILRGWDALDKVYTPENKQKAREYAIKYLGVKDPALGTV
jgi:hypothetical protein